MKICNAYSPHKLRRSRNRISHFTDSGWSFSSFGGPSKIREKLESIAHTEFNNEKFKNLEHIINCQKTGSDLFQRKVQAKKIDKAFFPNELLKLMEENPTYYFGFKV